MQTLSITTTPSNLLMIIFPLIIIFPSIIQSLQIPLLKTSLFDGIYTSINNDQLSTIIKIDMKSQHTFIYSSTFINIGTKVDNTTHNISLPFKPYYLQSSLLTSSISLPAKDGSSYFIDNIYLYYYDNANDAGHYLQNLFPLAPTYQDDNFSLIHKMYLNKLITEESFGIVFAMNNSVNSQLYIDEIPSDIMNYYTHKCKIKNNSNKWNCDLNKVIVSDPINNKHELYYDNYDFAYFDSSSKFILAPQEFITFLKKEVLKEFIRKQECIVDGFYNIRQIECVCDVVLKDDFYFEVSFVFQGIKLKIKKELLFERYGKTCGMLIEVNTFNKTEWVIGEPLFREYFMKFNINEQSIMFYSKNNLSVSSIRNINVIFKLYRFIIILLISTCIFNLFVYIKKF